MSWFHKDHSLEEIDSAFMVSEKARSLPETGNQCPHVADNKTTGFGLGDYRDNVLATELAPQGGCAPNVCATS